VSICRERNITLIEDAAQAIGSNYWGKSDYCAVSLQAIKALTSGDGGVLVCKREEDYKKAKRLRWFGYDREEKQKLGDADLKEAGYKYHMNNVSAAIGRGNLVHIPAILARQRELAQVYRSHRMFAHAWLAGGFTKDYPKLKSVMAAQGIEVGQHHYRNDKYTIFKEFKTECPVMDELEGAYFFVPNHYGVTVEDAYKIGRLYHDLQTYG
jgi:dTDP-4-amino-4,6-dideoxygalactose transaminase